MFVKLRRFLAVLIALLAVCPACAAPDYGQELFDILLARVEPARAELCLQEMPAADGTIPWAYLECQNADVSGMNVRSLRVEVFDAVVTPPAQWKDVEYPRVKSMLACRAEGIFTQDDVNAFLRNRFFGHEKEWERVSVKLENDRVYAEATCAVDVKLMRVKLRMEVSCRVVGRGTGIWLEDVIVKVNGKKLSKVLVNKAIAKIQPVLDMSKYNLPLYLTKIELSDGVCRVATRLPPHGMTDGLKWEYEKPEGADMNAEQSEVQNAAASSDAGKE